MVTRPAEAALFDLREKVVLITGAARRIGRDVALRLHAAGAKVAIHYSRSQDEARATAAECGGAPVFAANLESVAGIERLFAEVGERCGRIDALVNNAARFTRKHALDVTEADWDFIHGVNLKAYFFCAQQAARMMRAQGSSGRIVNISSLGGLQPWAEHVPYCVSKAGVIMMTRALAKALAPDITVNSVAPGFIPYEDKDYTQTSEGMIRDTPARRAGSGDEIADAVLFFLQSSSYITGQTIAVDGGLSLR
jgi:NAD(P)-dependent dehydrogenase (short-subunit alcohol dehydrogenase family)